MTVRHHRRDPSHTSRAGQRQSTTAVDSRNARQHGGQPSPLG
jgi:hypothetical protein